MVKYFTLALATSSSKRGLAYTPNNRSLYPEDSYVWTRQPSDLTWYYDYVSYPISTYSNLSQSAFEFVPMMGWAPTDPSDTEFLKNVTSLIKDHGINIKNVMTFNEPDLGIQGGGSQVDPAFGAKVWVNNIIPLQKMGIRVGLPACSGGPGGIPWTKQFLDSCSKLISTQGKTQNCTYDFVGVHWYGDFKGLAGHLGEYTVA
jgi:hypothetical protein